MFIAMESAKKAIQRRNASNQSSKCMKTGCGWRFFTVLLAMWAMLVAMHEHFEKWEYTTVTSVCCFCNFRGVNKSFDLYLRWRPEIVGGLTPAATADFLNTSVSLVHSCHLPVTEVIGLMLKEKQILGSSNVCYLTMIPITGHGLELTQHWQYHLVASLMINWT